MTADVGRPGGTLGPGNPAPGTGGPGTGGTGTGGRGAGGRGAGGPGTVRGGAAGAARRVLAQTRFETAAVLRNGEQLLLTLVLPVLALVVLLRTEVVPLPEPRPAAAVASALALAVAAQLTSQAIALAFDRRWGVLRMLATTPLGPRGLLAGRLGAVLCVVVVQVLVLLAVAAALGWRPAGGLAVGAAAGGAVLVLLGTAAFVALAMLLGGTLRAEAVLAVANLLWILLAGGGGLLLPLAALPAPVAAVASFLPSGALGEGLRTLAVTGRLDLGAVAVLLVWTVVAGWLAARLFRWD
ncbi:ABC transporter permease [Georgenia sp. TF02-10]|uniref:ABC transporter permease n=1 Tax=Georgenia sp. TF02-10 TaxID=2917725 RepID=UPI001FA6C513|nr:ABC transporter permease [Georgenia sp. TF02-10]UNX56043.1 ABC transporter permease [Georgenia sp. TF02-10]